MSASLFCSQPKLILHFWMEGIHIRALHPLILGPKFSPIPNAKKYVFPNSTKKFPILHPPKKLIVFFFGGGGGGFSIFFSYNTNTEYIVTYLQFHRIIEYNLTLASFSPFSHSTLINIHYSSLIIGINLAMEMSNFPILVQTPLIFPIPWAPAPFPKRGVRALHIDLVQLLLIRPLVKSVYQIINFLISQPKHMLWVLKRTVSMRWFFCAPIKYAQTDGLQKILHFYAQKFCLTKLNLCYDV